jgi:hypothetical protein
VSLRACVPACLLDYFPLSLSLSPLSLFSLHSYRAVNVCPTRRGE